MDNKTSMLKIIRVDKGYTETLNIACTISSWVPAVEESGNNGQIHDQYCSVQHYCEVDCKNAHKSHYIGEKYASPPK